MFGQLVITFGHQPDENVQVVDPVEREGLLFYEEFFVLDEFTRDLSIVKGRADMVNGVVAIIPAGLVVFGIDAIDGIVFQVAEINKSVLGPVAKHHHDSGENKGDDENEKGGMKIHKTHTDAKEIERHFTHGEAHIEFLPLAAEEIHKGITETKDEEAAHIGQETA